MERTCFAQGLPYDILFPVRADFPAWFCRIGEGLALYIIDRFEDETAFVEQEDGRMLRLPRQALPADVREGDVLRLCGEVYMRDDEATQQRREHIAAIKRRLLEKKQGGRGDA